MYLWTYVLVTQWIILIYCLVLPSYLLQSIMQTIMTVGSVITRDPLIEMCNADIWTSAGRNITRSVERLVTRNVNLKVITVWKAITFGIAFVFILPRPSRGNSLNCLNIYFQTMAVWWRRSNWNSWWCGVIKLRQIAREARGGWWRRQQAEARKKFLSSSGM